MKEVKRVVGPKTVSYLGKQAIVRIHHFDSQRAGYRVSARYFPHQGKAEVSCMFGDGRQPGSFKLYDDVVLEDVLSLDDQRVVDTVNRMIEEA